MLTKIIVQIFNTELCVLNKYSVKRITMIIIRHCSLSVSVSLSVCLSVSPSLSLSLSVYLSLSFSVSVSVWGGRLEKGIL